MNHRLMAIVWNRESIKHDRRAADLLIRIRSSFPDWKCALHVPGLSVFHSGEEGEAWKAYPLRHRHGVILGTLFTQDTSDGGYCENTCFDDRETNEILRSNGRHLLEHYWGRYVAFYYNDARAIAVHLLRDPTGGVPCFVCSSDGIEIACSHVADCAALGLIRGSINWEHVAAYLWFDRLVTADTGLHGLRQVLAGECIDLGSNGRKSVYAWRPDRLYREHIIEDTQQAMRKLRATVQHCVAEWGSRFGTILHELSGGLDSAVVLASLTRAPFVPNIVCENHFTVNAAGDERNFARQAAKLANVELLETPVLAARRSLADMFATDRCASPAQLAYIPDSHLSRKEIVVARGVKAVFSGRGGDHLFQRTKSPQIAAEYVRIHGLRDEYRRVIRETSRFTKQPIWFIAAVAISSGLLRRSFDPYTAIRMPRLVAPETRDALDRSHITHPWVDLSRDLPGSKRQQIFHIVDTQLFYHVANGYADIVHPLISQPIIELCLQIPTYILAFGGIDRGLIRQAFSGIIPESIRNRTDKGTTNEYLSSLLGRNLQAIREFLMDGLLVQEGLLNRSTLEDVLRESCLLRDVELLFPVLDAVRAEIWANSWNPASRRATG